MSALARAPFSRDEERFSSTLSGPKVDTSAEVVDYSVLHIIVTVLVLLDFLLYHSRACPSKDSGLRLTPREAALAVLSHSSLCSSGQAPRKHREPRPGDAGRSPECSRGGRNYGLAQTLHGVYPERSLRVQGGRKRPSRSLCPARAPYAGFLARASHSTLTLPSPAQTAAAREGMTTRTAPV